MGAETKSHHTVTTGPHPEGSLGQRDPRDKGLTALVFPAASAPGSHRGYTESLTPGKGVVPIWALCLAKTERVGSTFSLKLLQFELETQLLFSCSVMSNSL